MKENIEKSKEKEKEKNMTKKSKTFSFLQYQRKSYIQKAKSPPRKSTITMKYIAVLNAKKTKKV